MPSLLRSGMTTRSRGWPTSFLLNSVQHFKLFGRTHLVRLCLNTIPATMKFGGNCCIASHTRLFIFAVLKTSSSSRSPMLAADRCTGLLDLHDGLRVLAGTSRFGTGTNTFALLGKSFWHSRWLPLGRHRPFAVGAMRQRKLCHVRCSQSYRKSRLSYSAHPESMKNNSPCLSCSSAWSRESRERGKPFKENRQHRRLSGSESDRM